MNAKRTKAGTYVANRRWKAEQRPTAVRRVLKNSPNSTATISQITKVLQEKDPSGCWTQKEVVQAIKWAQDKTAIPGKSKKNWDIRLKQGGKSAMFISSSGVNKRGGGQLGQITDKLNSDSPAKALLAAFAISASKIRATDVHASSRKIGKWSEPDIIVEFFPFIGSKKPFEIHSIELEEKSSNGTPKCQPQEVAQAFASGQGADRSWLMFHESEWPNDRNEPRRAKVEWLANELGVGLITFSSSHKSATWKLVKKAKKRKSKTKDIASFKALLPD
jgi:hypothetical protein